MPPIYMRDEPHRLTVTVEMWVNHHPGNENHLKVMLESMLRAKGIQTEQSWKDGKPEHAVVFVVDK